MFSEPDDSDVRERMHAAFADATVRIGCTSTDGATEAWGHSGRTIGAPVRTSCGDAWLRVLEVPEGKEGGKLWTGAQEAAATLPTDVPRPELLVTADWTHEGYATGLKSAPMWQRPSAPRLQTSPNASRCPRHGGRDCGRPSGRSRPPRSPTVAHG